MPRDTELQELERLRGNPVIAYVTGDRPPITAHIADDAVRPFFDVLRDIGRVKTLDLFIYSRGGAIEVPWRIASALRQYADTWNILVPFRANSAATLLALGADKIILGRHGELGPIDPIINFQIAPGGPSSFPPQDSVSVEDVMAYITFIKDQVGLTDQSTLAAGLHRLAERLDAVGIGKVHRTRSHIRDVAHRMLASQRRPPSERATDTIVDTLATRVYAHGHAIGLTEAKQIGLQAEQASNETEEAMWHLLQRYETDLRLREPVDLVTLMSEARDTAESVPIAVVESTKLRFEFNGNLEVRGRREMPETLGLSLDVRLELPSGLDLDAVLANADETIRQHFLRQISELRGQMLTHAQLEVRSALEEQAPIVGVYADLRDAQWRQVPPEVPISRDEL